MWEGMAYGGLSFPGIGYPVDKIFLVSNKLCVGYYFCIIHLPRIFLSIDVLFFPSYVGPLFLYQIFILTYVNLRIISMGIPDLATEYTWGEGCRGWTP